MYGAPGCDAADIIRSTGMFERRISLLNSINKLTYTQSAAASSDNHMCIQNSRSSSAQLNTYTECCTNNSIIVSSATHNKLEANPLDVFKLELDSHTNMLFVGRCVYNSPYM